MARGFFLALEGIDGAGTTTQARLLAEHLLSHGQRVHLTAEPSRGPIGRLLREGLQTGSDLDETTLGLLFAADRIDHLAREIEPQLASGAVVVSDRYLLSSLAYQSGTLPLDWVVSLNARARRPDASVLLDVTPAVAKARRQARGGATERFDADERQKRIAETYRQVFARTDVGPTFVLSADGSIDAVRAAFTALVEGLLKEARS